MLRITYGADLPLVVTLMQVKAGEVSALNTREVSDLEVALIGSDGVRKRLYHEDAGENKVRCLYATRQTGVFAVEVTGVADGLRMAWREKMLRVGYFGVADGRSTEDGVLGFHVRVEVARF